MKRRVRIGAFVGMGLGFLVNMHQLPGAHAGPIAVFFCAFQGLICWTLVGAAIGGLVDFIGRNWPLDSML
jgi:hypothetical protein